MVRAQKARSGRKWGEADANIPPAGTRETSTTVLKESLHSNIPEKKPLKGKRVLIHRQEKEKKSAYEITAGVARGGTPFRTRFKLKLSVATTKNRGEKTFKSRKPGPTCLSPLAKRVGEMG